MCLSSAVRAIVVLQLFSSVLCQFPMPFPFQMGAPQMGAPMGMGGPQPMGMGGPQPLGPPQQMGPPNMAPMAPLPPLAPQPMFSPPMPMPMSFPMHQKMSSVVMPYYRRSAADHRHPKKYRKKKRKPKRHVKAESWESNESSGSESGDFEFRRSNKRRQVLTPVVSYVTKDGYVVYQKRIKKDKAKDWLEMNKKPKESQELFSSAEERQFQKMLKHKRRKKHHGH